MKSSLLGNGLIVVLMGSMLLPLTLAQDDRLTIPMGDQETEVEAANILSSHCLECHDSREISGGLDLATRFAAEKGGDSGPSLDVLNPLESLLWKRIQADEMPPEHPLSQPEKLAIQRWLQSGARWPASPIDRFDRSTDRRAGRDWWSLQPLGRVEPPSQTDDRWSKNELDGFILGELRRHNLQPSQRADARTRVRRLYFDLIGLPPPYEVVEAFEQDPSDVHWNKIVDELLASNQYGEHWGNHWLDVARFGESHGFEYNQPRDGAWHYRDWVISALNRDLPYDEFVQHQIAGDSFFGEGWQGIAPLGFLVAGTHNNVLGNSEAMRATSRQEELEEIAGTLGQAFLGLTVNCARCHDHKFDPLPTEDYYRFISNLTGINHGNRIVNTELPLESRNQLLTRRDRLQAQLHASYRQRGVKVSQSANLLTTRLPATSNRAGETYRLVLDIAPTVWADASQATGTEERLAVSILRQDQQSSAIHNLSAGDWKPAEKKQVFQRHAIEYVGDGSGPWILQLASLSHRNKFAAAIDRIECLDSQGNQIWLEEFVPQNPDPMPGTQAVTRMPVHCRLAFPEWSVEGLNAAHAVEYEPGKYALQIFGGVEDASPHPETEQEKGWSFELLQIDEKLRGRSIFTVLSGTPGITRVLRRGDVMQAGQQVRPGGLSMIHNLNHAFEIDDQADDRTRRRKLADWITASGNGLFQRVAVNRVWHYHFGKGLVEKTSDLGFNGGYPSHPELLEWLANWFQEHGYSLKQLHRLIVMSETWQQSSRSIDNPTAQAALASDVSNRLLWRQNTRRLTAEMLRDGILQIVDVLDRQVGGEGYRDFLIDKIGEAHYYRYRGELDPRLWRRSVYRFRVRGDRSALLESFDCPDPSATTPIRNVTTTPTQALALWNNDLILELSSRLAESLKRELPTSDAREIVEAAWKMTLQRSASQQEIVAATDLVKEHGLEALIRVLFNSNELLTID